MQIKTQKGLQTIENIKSQGKNEKGSSKLPMTVNLQTKTNVNEAKRA